MLVSCTSGLSTQVVPENTISRVVILGVMIVGAIFLPSQIGDLVGLIRSTSKYSTSFIPAKNRFHVVIVGNLEIVSLRGFLKEFFSVDHGTRTMKTHVVLLSPGEPSMELETLLSDPVYSNRVRYVRGSAMSFRSLQKVHLLRCSAAFVLASRLSQDEPVQEDAKTVMRCVVNQFD